MPKRFLFIVNEAHFFVSHRLPIAEAARNQGYDVHIASRPGAGVTALKKAGFQHHAIPLSRQGTNPVMELGTFFSVLWLLIKLHPHILHSVTIKPVLYGGIAARIVGIKCYVAAISGLGPALVSVKLRTGLVGWVVRFLYRIALSHPNQIVIFQNPTDRKIISTIASLNERDNLVIPGSGVTLEDYDPTPPPIGTPCVLMASRLLWSKGVAVFAQAAKLLYQRGVNVNLVLAGAPDKGSLDSVGQQELDAWSNIPNLNVIGHQDNISALLHQASIVALPSIYGEGLPKILIEAAASARAVVTTDHPGCRDAILPGQTGLLCSTDDADSLAKAIQSLIEHPKLCAEMGRKGMELAKASYSIDEVIRQHLAAYKKLESQI